MKRVIVRYEKLTQQIMDLLIEKYPDVYNCNDVITYKNKEGVNIKAVEVRTDDTIYLVKVSEKLQQTMEDYMEDEDNFIENNYYDDVII